MSPALRQAGAWLVLVCTATAALADDPAAQAERLVAEAQRHFDSREYRDAERFYRRALELSPNHANAYLQLQRIVNALGPADSAAQRDRLAKQFPDGFYLKQTEHYLILYDGPHSWADSRAKMLELTHDRFYQALRSAGFRPLPLGERVVCVLFNEHDDYEAYSKRVDRVPHNWASGHYSPRTNRVAFFNIYSAPHLREMLARLRELEYNADQLRNAAAKDRTLRGRYITAARQAAKQQQLYQLNIAYGNIQQTLHEAAHQLAYNTNLQSRRQRYPMWYAEGLATCFETIAPAAPFGPAHDNPQRRRPLVKAIRAGRDIPLADFVTLFQPPDDKDKREVAYAQAWGLWHYLFNHRLAQLRAYTEAMLTGPARRDAESHKALFIEVFGDLPTLHRAYRQHVASLEP